MLNLTEYEIAIAHKIKLDFKPLDVLYLNY